MISLVVCLALLQARWARKYYAQRIGVEGERLILQCADGTEVKQHAQGCYFDGLNLLIGKHVFPVMRPLGSQPLIDEDDLRALLAPLLLHRCQPLNRTRLTIAAMRRGNLLAVLNIPSVALFPAFILLLLVAF